MIAFRIALAALVLPIVMFASLAGVAPADACSADETWDPVAESAVIVGGQIESYTPLPDRSPVGMYIPIRLDMRIDHVWKGNLPVGTEILDRASLLLLPVFTDHDELRITWAGSGGACGVFNEDPSGRYAILGLFTAPDGTLQTSSLRTFYLSPQPYDPASTRLLSQRIGFPVAGAGKDTAGAPNPIEALLAGGAALLVAGIIWRTHDLSLLGRCRRGLRRGPSTIA